MDCIKCAEPIKIYGRYDEVFCSCGAHYTIMKAEIIDQQVDMEYTFMGFKCIYSSFSDHCQSPCPAPSMYCKKHCSDEAIETAKKDIDYSEQRLAQTKDKLYTLEESKKNWLIQEMSGLDEKEK